MGAQLLRESREKFLLPLAGKVREKEFHAFETASAERVGWSVFFTIEKGEPVCPRRKGGSP